MTGWGMEQAMTMKIPTTQSAPPSAATLNEAAAAAQRAQLKQLIDALRAHPDLAATVYLSFGRSP